MRQNRTKVRLVAVSDHYLLSNLFCFNESKCSPHWIFIRMRAIILLRSSMEFFYFKNRLFFSVFKVVSRSYYVTCEHKGRGLVWIECQTHLSNISDDYLKINPIRNLVLILLVFFTSNSPKRSQRVFVEFFKLLERNGRIQLPDCNNESLIISDQNETLQFPKSHEDQRKQRTDLPITELGPTSGLNSSRAWIGEWP